MLSALLILSQLALARLPGTVLPVAPSVAPGRVAPMPEDPLAEARTRWQQGDANGVVALMAPYAQSRAAKRDFSSVHMLLGRAWLALDQPAAASSAFYRVRARGGAIARSRRGPLTAARRGL